MSPIRPLLRGLGLASAIGAIVSVCAPALAGTWTPLVHGAPGQVALMMLLSDGTVIAANNGGAVGSGWFRLKPDSHGNYVNGTWSNIAPMHDTRLWYSSAVLRDGRVFVAGGEYGSGAARAEVYDPVTNVWTDATPPASVLDPTQTSAIGGTQKFWDSDCVVTANGSVLITPVFPKTYGGTVIFNPVGNTWSTGPTLANNVVYQDEASWVKLPDDSILTIDPFGRNTQRYIPALNAWISDATAPVDVYDPFGGEMGAAMLLANGKAFFMGATGHTAIYTPSGSTSPGTWVAGPDIPGAHAPPDAPAAMMYTGNILCAVSPLPTSGNHFPTPTTFYEYNPVANSFTSIAGPTGPSDNIPSYEALMLDLPDGTVLYSHFGTDLYVYTPTGSPLASGKPSILSVTDTGNRTYHLTGTKLNGISEGAAYGDDAQMSTNYPIVRLSDGGGNVYYARTYNWSSTGVQTGNLVVSTDFKLPGNLLAGDYAVSVIANGIASDPFPQLISTPAPPTPGPFNLLNPADGATGVASNVTLDWSDSSLAADYVVTLDDNADFSSPVFSFVLTQSQLALTTGTLQNSHTYYWSVAARTVDQVVTLSTPAAASFATLVPPPPCACDFNHDHRVDTSDLAALLGYFGTTVPPGSTGDANGDGFVGTADLTTLLGEFGHDCP